MRTFHQDKSNRLKANLKTAAKNTMRTMVQAGKALSEHISKKAVVFAAVAAISMSGSNAQAQGLLDKVLGVMEKVENTAYKVGEPFRKFNKQYDRTKRAIDDTQWHVSETDRRLGGALSAGANMVQGVIDRQVSNRILNGMEQGQVGSVPLIAEEGGQAVSVSSGTQRAVYSNPTGLNVVGEVSLDELMSRGNTTSVAGNTTVPSSAARVSTTSSSEITLDELAAYTNAHSSSNGGSAAAVRARRAEVSGQSVGGSGTQETSQVKKQTRKLSTEELYAQMVKEGYVK